MFVVALLSFRLRLVLPFFLACLLFLLVHCIFCSRSARFAFCLCFAFRFVLLRRFLSISAFRVLLLLCYDLLTRMPSSALIPFLGGLGSLMNPFKQKRAPFLSLGYWAA